MKKLLLLFSFFFAFNLKCYADEISKYSESAILTEASTGNVLYEKDADRKSAPASMTKIMSMALIMDAIKEERISLNSDVLISENAAKMGGSQVYLNVGETYKVYDLLKSIAIASANDAVVAMSEKVAGTEEKFVDMMNKKCKELGCKETNFTNPHGLDDENHYSSARDMSLISRYLINNYPEILDYTSIYEDYLQRPDGTNTWLVNTNKLVRFYDSVDGLKTGFTSKAGYCLTATANKNNMRLISVVMGVDSPDNRTSDTVRLLNYGFNSFKISLIYKKDKVLGTYRVEKGNKEKVQLVLLQDAKELLSITDKEKKYSLKLEINKLVAPLKKGDIVGKAKIIDNTGNVVGIIEVTVKDNIIKAGFKDYFKRNFKTTLYGKNIIL